MEAIISKSELALHKKTFLKTTKPRKGIIRKSYVILTISDKFKVRAPGIEHAMECKPIAWGKVAVPYLLWRRLMETLKFTSEKEMTIVAEDGELRLDKLTIRNPNIQAIEEDATLNKPQVIQQGALGSDLFIAFVSLNSHAPFQCQPQISFPLLNIL